MVYIACRKGNIKLRIIRWLLRNQTLHVNRVQDSVIIVGVGWRWQLARLIDRRAFWRVLYGG